METVVLVNAAPGYEERVASSLQDEDGVAGIAAVQKENFNMAILLDVDGPNKLQKFLTNTLMFVSGVQGAELEKDPTDDLMARLEGEGPGGQGSRGGRGGRGGGRGGGGRPGGREPPGGSGPSRPSDGPGDLGSEGDVPGPGRPSDDEEDVPGVDDAGIPGPGDEEAAPGDRGPPFDDEDEDEGTIL
jgi:hypothetical protein